MIANNTERTERRGVAMAMSMFESLGFAFREQSESDYGIDAHVEYIDKNRPTGQLLGIQIKTGASYLSDRTAHDIVFRADADHVDYWLKHSLPVIICICDLDNQKVYWQKVTRETAVSTGKGYRFSLPLKQVLDETSVSQFVDLLTPVVSPDRYTIFKTQDTSHGFAKRYSFNLVVNGKASKAQIASIVRQVTIEGAKRRYHRDHLIEGRWGDSDAHVVGTFVYPSAEDEVRHNHICSSLWINDALPEKARPFTITGENIGDGIIVDWNENYDSVAKHRSTQTMSKEDYLSAVIPRINELKQLLDDVGSHLLSLNAGDVTEKVFLNKTDTLRQRISDIYMATSDMSLAPFECSSMDQCFACLVTCMDNIVLHYSHRGLDTWSASNRLKLSLQQREYALEHLGELEYELKKVR